MSDFERALVEGIFGSKKIDSVKFIAEVVRVVGNPRGNAKCNWRGISEPGSAYMTECGWDSKWIGGMSYCPFCGGAIRLNAPDE